MMETDEKKKKFIDKNAFDINSFIGSTPFGVNPLGFSPFMPFHPLLGMSPMLPTSTMPSLLPGDQFNLSSINGSENGKSPNNNESLEWWKSYQNKSQIELNDALFPNPFLNSMFPPLWNPTQVSSLGLQNDSNAPSRPSSRPISASTTNSKQPSPSIKSSRNSTQHNSLHNRTDSESSSILSPQMLRPPSSSVTPLKRPDVVASPASTFTTSFSSPTNIDLSTRDDQLFSPINPFMFPFGAMSALSAFGGLPMPYPSSILATGMPPFMLPPIMPDFMPGNFAEMNDSKRSPSVRDSPFSHKSHSSRKTDKSFDITTGIKSPSKEFRDDDLLLDGRSHLFESSLPSLNNQPKEVVKNKLVKSFNQDLSCDALVEKTTIKEEANLKQKLKTNKNSARSNLSSKNTNHNSPEMGHNTPTFEPILDDVAIDLSMKKPRTSSSPTKPLKSSRASPRQSKIPDPNPADFLAALAHSHQAQMLASAATFPDPFNFPSLLPQLYDNLASMFYPQNALAAIATAAAAGSNDQKVRRGRRSKVTDTGKNQRGGGSKSTGFISSLMGQMNGFNNLRALEDETPNNKVAKKRSRGKGKLFNVPAMTFQDIEKLHETSTGDMLPTKGSSTNSSTKKESIVQSSTSKKNIASKTTDNSYKSNPQSIVLPLKNYNDNDEVLSNTDSSDPINGLNTAGSKSEKRKSKVDINSNNKRKRLGHTNEQLQLPLNLGWKRETRIEYITQDKVFGAVTYITPCGKIIASINELKEYLQYSANALTIDNFSFNKGRKLGKFYQCINDKNKIPPSDTTSCKEMNDDHVEALISAIEIQRQFLLLQRINKNNKAIAGSQDEFTEETKRQRDEKRSQKLAERLNRQQLLRMERDVKLMQMQEERDAKKMQVNQAKEQEKERRKNYILLTKVMETRKKEEVSDKERLKEEKKQARKIDRDKKIEQKRMEFFMAKELQKPSDDMLLTDSQALPDLDRILGMRLQGKAFANCLTILEFVHNFATTLKIENDLLPTLTMLQGGLLNEPDCEQMFINFFKRIIKLAFDDPGFNHPRDGILQYGQKILDIEITKENISEIIRIFIRSRNGPNDEMVDWLKYRPFDALNASDKSSIIVFFCNEILTSKLITADIERNIEVINNQRKDKWILDGKLRKLRQQLVNRHRSNNANRMKEESMATGVGEGVGNSGILSNSFDSKKDCTDDEQSNACSNDEAEHLESDVEDDDKTISTEELESKIEKINKQLIVLNEKTNLLNHQLSIAPCGQDRFHRLYWIFPKCGGIYIEGVESAEPELFNSIENVCDGSINCDPNGIKIMHLKDIEQKLDDSKNISETLKLDKKEKSTDCDSALIPLLCVHG